MIVAVAGWAGEAAKTDGPYVFLYGAGEPRLRARLGERLRVVTEDCFSGKLGAARPSTAPSIQT